MKKLLIAISLCLTLTACNSDEAFNQCMKAGIQSGDTCRFYAYQ